MIRLLVISQKSSTIFYLPAAANSTIVPFCSTVGCTSVRGRDLCDRPQPSRDSCRKIFVSRWSAAGGDESAEATEVDISEFHRRRKARRISTKSRKGNNRSRRKNRSCRRHLVEHAKRSVADRSLDDNIVVDELPGLSTLTCRMQCTAQSACLSIRPLSGRRSRRQLVNLCLGFSDRCLGPTIASIIASLVVVRWQVQCLRRGSLSTGDPCRYDFAFS